MLVSFRFLLVKFGDISNLWSIAIVRFIFRLLDHGCVLQTRRHKETRQLSFSLRHVWFTFQTSILQYKLLLTLIKAALSVWAADRFTLSSCKRSWELLAILMLSEQNKYSCLALCSIMKRGTDRSIQITGLIWGRDTIKFHPKGKTSPSLK